MWKGKLNKVRGQLSIGPTHLTTTSEGKEDKPIKFGKSQITHLKGQPTIYRFGSPDQSTCLTKKALTAAVFGSAIKRECETILEHDIIEEYEEKAPTLETLFIAWLDGKFTTRSDKQTGRRRTE